MAGLGKEVINLVKKASRERKSSRSKKKSWGKGSGADKLMRMARKFLK